MSIFRKAISSIESAMLSSKQSLGMELKLPIERDIFRFDTKKSIEDWVASSDRAIGGLSTCQWDVYRARDEKSVNEQAGAAELTKRFENLTVKDEVPSAVFSGKLSLDCQPTEVGIVRSGYCAVRTSIPYGIHLHGFEGLAMRIMTDGRTYRMNAQMDSWNPLDIYMGFITTPPGKWVDVELSFKDFIMTSKGYYKIHDPTPLNPSKLRRIGFAISDQKEGDFEMRVQWIKAIRTVETKKENGDREYDDGEDTRESLPRGAKKPAGLAI